MSLLFKLFRLFRRLRRILDRRLGLLLVQYTTKTMNMTKKSALVPQTTVTSAITDKLARYNKMKGAKTKAENRLSQHLGYLENRRLSARFSTTSTSWLHAFHRQCKSPQRPKQNGTLRSGNGHGEKVQRNFSQRWTDFRPKIVVIVDCFKVPEL